MGSSLTRALSGSHGGKSTGDARRNRMTITNQKGFPKHEGGSDQEDQSSISAGPVFGKVADPKEKKLVLKHVDLSRAWCGNPLRFYCIRLAAEREVGMIRIGLLDLWDGGPVRCRYVHVIAQWH